MTDFEKIAILLYSSSKAFFRIVVWRMLKKLKIHKPTLFLYDQEMNR